MKSKTLLMLACIGMMAACNPDAPIKKNAMLYAQHMADYDIDGAYPYATPETQTLTLDFFKTKILPALNPSYIDSNTPATLYVDSIVRHSDTEAIVYYHKRTPIVQHLDATLEMRLRDGQWLAHQPIKAGPFFSGGFHGIDTAELRANPDRYRDSLHKMPSVVIPLQTNK